jgi:hypothetical protein
LAKKAIHLTILLVLLGVGLFARVSNVSAYQVVGNLYLSNTTCSGAADAVVPTAVLQTNISGNSTAEHIFIPEDAAGLHGLTVGARWQVWDGATLSYQTRCTVVTLD